MRFLGHALHHRRPQTVRKVTKRETQDPSKETKKRGFATQQQQEFQGSGALPVPVVWLHIKPGTSPSPDKMMRDKMVGDKAPGESRVTNPKSSYPRKPKITTRKISLCEIHALVFLRITYTPHVDSALYTVKPGVITQKVSLHG